MKSITTHYHWASDSKIANIEMVEGEEKKLTAHIHANGSQGPGSLAELPKELRKYGFKSEGVVVENGRNVITVPGLRPKDAEKLLVFLSGKQFTSGKVEVAQTTEHTNETFFGRMQDDALRYSGKFGIPGHLALMGRGVVMGDASLPQFAQGLFGLTVPSILTIGGNGQDQQNFDPLIQQMRAYFKKEGVPFPDADTPAAVEHERRNFAETAKHFIMSHPIPIAYGIGSVGAAMGIKAALAEGNIFRTVASGVSLAGNGIVLAVPENKEQEDQSPLSKLISECKDLGKACLHPTTLPRAVSKFAKDGPVAMMGMINLADNVFFGLGWWKERKTHLEVNANPQENRDQIAMKSARKAEIEGMSYKDITSKLSKEAKTLGTEIGILEKQLKVSHETPWKGKAAYLLSGVTLLTWGASSAMAAISSKNANKKQRDEALNTLYSAMAKLIVEFPLEDRETTLKLMGGYLSSQPTLQHLHLTSEKLVDEIRNRVDTMQHSPFVAALQNQKNQAAAGAGLSA